MTDRAEIERLLNQTGRTLEGLPEEHSTAERIDAMHRPGEWCEIVCHQSDVIELLVGALRDALDKPVQKPLTLEEFRTLMSADEDTAVYCEAKGDDHAYATILFNGNSVGRDGELADDDDLVWHAYGKEWRAWPSRPTDEEREAAAWES